MICFFKLALKSVQAARRPLGMCTKHRKQTQQYTRKGNEFPKQAPHEVAKQAPRMELSETQKHHSSINGFSPQKMKYMEEGSEYTLESFCELRLKNINATPTLFYYYYLSCLTIFTCFLFQKNITSQKYYHLFLRIHKE